MDSYTYYYGRAVKFLAIRPRSEKEVRDNLFKKTTKLKFSSDGKVDAAVVDKVIAKLKEQRFVNDEEFAAWWIEQRTRVTPRGTHLIKLELQQKGISKEICESALGSNQSGESKSDSDTARVLVEKKFAKYKGLSREEIYQKLGGYLARKGYSWDIIKKSIDSKIEEK